MRLVLIGPTSQLGSDLLPLLGAYDVVGLTHADLAVEDADAVGAALREHRPQIVVNTAAYHRVDDIEDQPERAFFVNAVGPRNLACACREIDAALVHFSTDYVFSGAKGRAYVETDPVDPVSVYGVSKAAGEMLVRQTLDRHFVVRPAGLYGVAGSSGKGGNFVETMLRLAREGRDVRVVDDQVTTPTYTGHLAAQVAALIETEQYGLYHATAEGECSWYEFAAAIFEVSGVSPKSLAPQTTAQSGAKARRPTYSVLDNAKLRAIGLDRMPHWREGLAAYFAARAARRA